MSRGRLSLGVVLALVATLAAGLAIDVDEVDLALASSLTALFLLLLPFFVFGTLSRPPRWLRSPERLLAGALGLLLPYVLYGWGTGAFRAEALARLGLFLSVPTVLVLLGRKHTSPTLWEALAVLAIWLPFDFRLLEGIWTWPERQGSYGYQVVLAVDLALFAFVSFRAVPDVGYRFRLRFGDLGTVLGTFAMLSAVLIPLGIAIDFIAYRYRAFELLELLGQFVAILLFVGIPEELLFRGLIQNLLELKWGRTLPALAVASAVFGAAHLNNGDAPNWAYALMATLAGVAYGLAYRRSGTIFVSALVHALVDTAWRGFFR